jgi:hypothetical protein
MFFRALGGIAKTARERIPSSLRSRLCFSRTDLASKSHRNDIEARLPKELTRGKYVYTMYKHF